MLKHNQIGLVGVDPMPHATILIEETRLQGQVDVGNGINGRTAGVENVGRVLPHFHHTFPRQLGRDEMQMG